MNFFFVFEMLKTSSVLFEIHFEFNSYDYFDEVNVIELKMNYIVRIIIMYRYMQIHRLMILILI